MSELSTHNQTELAILAKAYLNALLDKNRHKAEQLVMDRLKQGASIKDIYLHVFQESQREIGILWQHNKISVAMEHFCTAATQLIMSRLYSYIFSYERNKKGLNLVSTSVSGELHELGIRMVTDFFEMDGWNTYYLGANTPKEGVLDMIKDCKADLLAVSATIYFNIPQVEELISYIKNEYGNDHLKIIVGGNAFNMKPDLWTELNADLFALNAQDAVQKANNAFL
ncbi:cobalamin B12-binding domain-containing protein [Carboxylicivirga sp. RSCT41]|uniref:cobalamin B12-binding domain-containing protein n=1 Tax=Carboxylicivirga agarovorans TaxID=3417570 RepID=UPI003D357C48